MPVYEYICDDCSKAFEALTSMSKPSVPCPDCGSKKVTRQFSTFAAHMGAPSPCKSGTCPSSGRPSGGCSGGGCPFS
ncbi:MAG: zinc ribbon domain-containing protein [Planctomycetaceae bacterium]|nr:MAG: zinc ribbon domain-containing protein [Planctomycetaceae bacterium]